ncbi:ROK family protein [Mucilaginibacter sp. PAMB04274]|uniref:ROK family protein n=1 Tax=Mucilaginibacter sp. PAMB04274 TaxID=3138568 RepID=UPI0031F69334
MPASEFDSKSKKVVRSLYHGKNSCATISAEVGLSIPSVQKIINALLQKGWISESGVGISSGGRKPATYVLNANRLYILCVAMDQFTTRVGLTDLQNNFVTPVHEFELKLHNNVNATQDLVNGIALYLKLANIDSHKIIAAGIAMPGFVNEADGINYSYLPVDDGHNLKEYLSEKLKMPVFIFNDSNAVAQAELKFGLGAAFQEMMVINIGWGIGLGMIINGKMYNGYSGFAGEFSHIPLVKNGQLCTCGKHGCLETVASLIAVEERAIKEMREGLYTTSLTALGRKITAQDILEEAGKGDRFCIKLIAEAGYHIGEGLAILLHIMNPQVIVLSGKGAAVGKLWLAPIQQAINEHSIPRLASFTEIAISELGNNAELIGAASFVMENIHSITITE